MGMYGRHLDKNGKELPRRGTDVVTGVSLTKQSFREEADINEIIRRFDKNGMVNINLREGFFGDVSNIRDYKEASDLVLEADRLFMGMSAEIRNRFQNDPAQMIAFLDDPKNLDEAVKLGICNPKPPKVEDKSPEELTNEARIRKEASESKKKGKTPSDED